MGAVVWVVAAIYLWHTSVPSLHLGGLDEHRYFSAELLDRAHSYGTGAQVLWLLGTLATDDRTNPAKIAGLWAKAKAAGTASIAAAVQVRARMALIMAPLPPAMGQALKLSGLRGARHASKRPGSAPW